MLSDMHAWAVIYTKIPKSLLLVLHFFVEASAIARDDDREHKIDEDGDIDDLLPGGVRRHAS